jgi:type III secretory pathway component EscR
MIYLTALALILIAFIMYVVLSMQHQRNLEEQWREERQDLLNRVMAKDIQEYKEVSSKPVEYEPVTVSEEDEYWMEIEEQKR